MQSTEYFSYTIILRCNAAFKTRKRQHDVTILRYPKSETISSRGGRYGKKIVSRYFCMRSRFRYFITIFQKNKNKKQNRGYKAFLIRRLNPSFSTVAKGTMSLARWYVIASVTSLHRFYWTFHTGCLFEMPGLELFALVFPPRRSRWLTGGGGCARHC